MKFLIFPLLVMATQLINADNGEFENISISGSKEPIIEQTPKATKDIGWQFELANKAKWNIALKLSQDGITIIPDQLPQGSLVEDGFFVLKPGNVVRVAELRSIQDGFRFGRESIDVGYYHELEGKFSSTHRNYSIYDDKTIYLEYKDGELKPVEKSFFKRSTDSGLPLDKNIKE